MLAAYEATAARCPGVDSAGHWTESQKELVGERLAGEAEPLARWLAICQAVEASERFSGRDVDTREPGYRDWRLTLTWLLKADNWGKVAKAGLRRSSPPSRLDSGRELAPGGKADVREKLASMGACFTDEQLRRMAAKAEQQGQPAGQGQ